MASHMGEPPRVLCLSTSGHIQPVGCGSGKHFSGLWGFQERIYRYGYLNHMLFYVLQLIIDVEESLLVIRGFGIQTSTSSSTYLSSADTRFIPTTQIQDIVIHEAFKGFEVRFYLAVIVEGEQDVLVVFPVNHLLPATVTTLTLPIVSIYYPKERFLKKSGEALGVVSMMRNLDSQKQGNL